MQQTQFTPQELSQLFNNSNDQGKRILEEKFGKETFSKIENILNSFEDACAYNGVTPDEVIPFKSPRNDDEKSVNAYAMLIQINRAFNAGKKKDWKNPNQLKYRSWYWMDGRSGSGLSLDVVDFVCSGATTASRLHVLDESHSELIFKRFPKIVEDFMVEID